ncbi:MAG: DUF1445 domain-containing protein [Verrucomicrobia bacterium]|nr:DUF1445 domain-containing protein [Verrucomicrobiota bacterium]
MNTEWFYSPERTPRELREAFRREEWKRPTKGMGLGYATMNLVIVPQQDAFDFQLFCFRNPKPCPLIEVLEAGNSFPTISAAGADIRTDLPQYRIYRAGKLAEEVLNIKDYWRDDLVTFLIGSTGGTDKALVDAGLPVRQLEGTRSHVAYLSSIPIVPAGRYHTGQLVVAMRPMTPAQAIRATEITARMPQLQGGPVHVGYPEAIGIADINQPDFGEAVAFREREIPVFWAGGVTAQIVAMASGIEFMIGHAAGHMFISDLTAGMLTV